MPGPLRILLADPNPRVRAAVKRTLVDAGHRITSVEDGEQAADAARRDPPDLVITAVDLPHVRGPELVRVVRSGRAPQAVPCIYLVPASDPRSLDPGLLGSVLRLPFPASALRWTVRRLMEDAVRGTPAREVEVAPPRPGWWRAVEGEVPAAPGLVPTFEDIDLDALDDESLPELQEVPFESLDAIEEPASAIMAEGRLADRPLGAILVAAMEASFTGALVLSRGEVEKRIHLRHGRPVYCESNLQVETLSEYLLQRGLIRPEDQAEARRRMLADRIHAGEALRQLGAISTEQLADAMHFHVREKVVNCFAWDDARYRLEVVPSEGQRVLAVEMEPLLLVADAVRRFTPPQELPRFLDAHASHYVIPAPSLARHLGALSTLPGGRLLARSLDGCRRLGELPAVTGLDQLLIVQLTLALLRSGLVTLDEAPSAQALAPLFDDELVAETEVRTGPAPGGALRPADDLRPEEAALRQEVLDRYVALAHQDHHAVLELPPEAPEASLAPAFARLVDRVGPDRLAGFPDPEVVRMAHEVYLRALQAYESLRDPLRRPGARRLSALQDAAREARDRNLDAEDHWREGEALLAGGHYAQAEAALRAAGRLNRHEPVYALIAGWAAYLGAQAGGDRARMEAGEAQIRRALEVLPILDEGYVFLARIAEDRGELQNAREMLARALLFHPANAEARAHLARLAPR